MPFITKFVDTTDMTGENIASAVEDTLHEIEGDIVDDWMIRSWQATPIRAAGSEPIEGSYRDHQWSEPGILLIIETGPRDRAKG